MRSFVLALATFFFAGHASAQVTCGGPGVDFTALPGSSVLNAYYPGPAMSGLVNVAAGSTSIPVDITGIRGSGLITAGDLLLVVQMQGATIDQTGQNTVGGNYGDGAGGDDRMGVIAGATFVAGTYELVIADGVAGANIPLRTPLRNAYSHSSTVVDNGDGTGIGFRRYQVVRVAEFRNLTIPAAATITSVPWNGRNGGVVALDVSGTLALNGTIDTSFMGFRGGSPLIPLVTDSAQPAVKGESLAGPVGRMYGLPVVLGTALTVTTGTTGLFGGDNGRGAPGNGGGCPTAGGGGLGTYNDSGGGGGGGGGDGGTGSIGPIAGTTATIPRGGAGYSDATRVFLGGGGGSGSVDDPVGVNGVSGQPGGGIIYVRAVTVSGAGTMVTDGRSGITNLTQEGGGGGGGGGSIFLYTSSTTLTGITLRARGGNGTSTLTSDDGGGGGGGGGHVVVATPGGAATATVDVAGGTGGTSPTAGDATGGTGGFQQIAAPPLGSSCPAVCGDGTLTAPETCDDSNVAAGDGCGATCRREVVVLAPADGSVTSDTTPTISGTADPGATVTITVGTVVRTATANGAGNWTTTVPGGMALPAGSYTAVAAAVATDGSTSSDSNAFRIDTSTMVAITAPTSGATTDATPTITGTGEPGATVVVSIDGASIGTATVSAGGTWTITSGTIAAGPHNVSAVATDAAGNTASAGPVPFVVDDTTMVAITSPTSGETTDATPTITGTGEPGATIAVRIDGAAAGTATVSAGGTWTLTSSTLTSGMHSVTAVATDAVGNTASAGPVPFVVDAGTMVAITSPTSGERTTTTPTISGTGEPGAMVVVSVDGTAIGTVTVSAGGTWMVTSSTLTSGAHTATAVATDSVGNTATATPVPFVVDDETEVVILVPDEGERVLDTTPAISGTGEAGASIDVTLTGPGGVTVMLSTTVAGDGTWSVTPGADLANGDWTAEATATDSLGNTESDTQSFIVGPGTFVTITSPADGGSTDDTTPTISGTGTPGAMVTVVVGGMTLGPVTVGADGTWSVTVPTALTDGTYTATATLTATGGETATDDATFSIDSGTSVDFRQPGDEGPIGEDTPELSGTGEPGASVEITLDGAIIGTVVVDADGNWSFQLTTPLAEGEHDVSVEATDDGGNTATDSGSFTVDVDFPSLEIDAPADGSTSSDTTPSITGRTDPRASVTVIVDGRILGVATSDEHGVWSFPVTTALTAGDHTVRASTTDAAGRTAEDEHEFTIDADAPAIDIVAPANGDSTSDTTPTIRGTTDPAATVQIFVGGVLVGTVTADGSGAWSIDVTTPLADGDHTVRAVATDAAGNVATDNGTFIVDTETFVTIVTPADESTIAAIRPRYFGAAEPGAVVEVTVDGTVIGTITAAADGSWSIEQPTDLAAGAHTVSAEATDSVGNTATASNEFTIDTTIMDTDMDGIVDPTECPTPGSCPDTDMDGTPDFMDPDDDGDGIPTRIECTTPGSCVDSDDDGTPDYLDPDDDGDGVPTRDERPGDVSQDTDGDTRPNHLDPDDDGDGIPTMEECPTPASCRDTDGDSTPDYLDPDDDDDGILTSRERADGMMFGDDVDDDGMPNWLDTESDGDGVDDMEEGLIDTDGMGPPDYLDPNFPVEMPDGGVPDGGFPDGGLPDGSVLDGSMLDSGPVSTIGGISGGACGCRVAPRQDASRGLVLLLIGLGALVWRRRR